MRWRIVREYHKLLGEGSQLPPVGLESLQSQFPDPNLNKRVIQVVRRPTL